MLWSANSLGDVFQLWHLSNPSHRSKKYQNTSVFDNSYTFHTGFNFQKVWSWVVKFTVLLLMFAFSSQLHIHLNNLHIYFLLIYWSSYCWEYFKAVVKIKHICSAKAKATLQGNIAKEKNPSVVAFSINRTHQVLQWISRDNGIAELLP